LTGDPKRVARFGIDFHKTPFAFREFAFDSLVFPACSNCNERFGKLEEVIKPIFVRLLAYLPLSSEELILLLDWLDKVRVGLWLGYLYLDKNPLGIDPMFHIESRIGLFDRMVSILRMEDAGIGLTFTGPEFKGYHLSPTCFGLGVNGLGLVNASGIDLCSQRLGFPFMQPLRIREDHKLEASYEAGSERIMNPVERRAALPRSSALYQPIFQSFNRLEGGEKFVASDWVRERSADVRIGYGKLFQQKPDSVQIYPDEKSSDWIPLGTWKKWEVMTRLPEYAYNRIRGDYERGISLASSKEDRKHMRKQGQMTKRLDQAMLRKANDAVGRVEGVGASVRRRDRRRSSAP
jgi:hypothetical protein